MRTVAVVNMGARIPITTQVEGPVVKSCTLPVRAAGGTTLRMTGEQQMNPRMGEVTVSHMLLVEGVEETVNGIDLFGSMEAKIDLQISQLKV